MTIRIDHLLSHWQKRRDDIDWVLATIIQTNLSTYRKAGAMMLMNSAGESYGMLSGGCLEGDLLAQSRRVLMAGKSIKVEYDLREDSDSQWQKGLGCGGAVSILLQAVSASNNYLGLAEITTLLSTQKHVVYQQRVDKIGLESPQWQVSPAKPDTITFFESGGSRITQDSDGQVWFQTLLSPAPRLLIFGGGRDAEPLAAIANTIGWQVTVVDQRHGYALEDTFPDATIIKQSARELTLEQHQDAIIIMTHNLTLDAEALRFSQASKAKYVGILGPQHRRERVEKMAGLSENDFSQFYCGPAGLNIGAKLPETIALSILSECHHIIEGKSLAAQEKHHAPVDTEKST